VLDKAGECWTGRRVLDGQARGGQAGEVWTGGRGMGRQAGWMNITGDRR